MNYLAVKHKKNVRTCEHACAYVYVCARVQRHIHWGALVLFLFSFVFLVNETQASSYKEEEIHLTKCLHLVA